MKKRRKNKRKQQQKKSYTFTGTSNTKWCIIHVALPKYSAYQKK